MQADVGAQGAAGVLSGLRQAYAGAFPSIPSPSSDGFHQFSGDVVKWAAAQQRAMRLPVSWNVQIVRFERAAARDRVLKAIARPSGAAGSAVGTFIIKVPRAAAEQVMQGDYRGKSFTVAGTLAPIVRFAPDRPTDGMSTHHSTFVGPYCEASIVLEAETIEPSADGS